MKFTKIALSLLLWTGIFLFWFLVHPLTLGFQEQNQLFLFTWDYLLDHLCRAGGFADYIAEFITQFNCIPWLGAALLAALMVCLQYRVWSAATKKNDGWYPLSFIPAILMLIGMGDIYVMPSHAVAICMALGCYWLYRRTSYYGLFELIAIPVLYWLAGPAMWIFAILSVIVRIVEHGFDGRSIAFGTTGLIYPALLVILAHYTLLGQYPMKAAIFGIGYYRMPLVVPAIQLITAGSAVLIPLLLEVLPEFRKPVLPAIVLTLLLAYPTYLGLSRSYDKATQQAIALDQLIRQERWKDAVSAANEFMTDSPECFVNLNLALCMSGHSVDDIAGSSQSGTEGLIMPRVRDLISNVGSYEVFWRLGMINSCLRYAFDSQESEMNNSKSGRHMSRIAECHMVNGNWMLAEKYLDILSHSLFYRKWAMDRKSMIQGETEPDPLYLYLQSVRFKEDFLYYYPEMPRMLAKLYQENNTNKMAAWYFNAWMTLMKQEEHK